MQPIIPVVRTEPFDDPGWLFELKLDGFRGLADTVNGSPRLTITSRTSRSTSAAFIDRSD